MRVIVAGSRDNVSQADIDNAIEASGWVKEITVVVSGAARGADRMGENWAKRNGITIDSHPADWDKHGKSAGYKRNQEMADSADALIAVWDGVSRGTGHMIDIAKAKKLRVFVYNLQSGCQTFYNCGPCAVVILFPNGDKAFLDSETILRAEF
jgi:hypothetical protein